MPVEIPDEDRRGWFSRVIDNDVAWSFVTTPTAMIAAFITVAMIALCFLAPWVAPFNPFDPASISLWDGKLPIIVGLAAVFLGMVLGVALGVIAGYMGGAVDAAIMRVADVQLTIPGLLLAILINGVARSILPPESRDELAIYVVIIAIGLTDWPQFARVTRGATMVEAHKEYVQAARVIGLPSWLIMARHVLPNVMRPVLVLATIGLALAIIAEATLSFLGQGIPPTTPSLGTLIRVGNDYLFSGLWWITLWPALALVVLVFAVNLLGDWMRDALNPKLR